MEKRINGERDDVRVVSDLEKKRIEQEEEEIKETNKREKRFVWQNVEN